MTAMTFTSKNMQAIFTCGSDTVHGMEAQSRSNAQQAVVAWHAVHGTLCPWVEGNDELKAEVNLAGVLLIDYHEMGT
jgi:hypothetical protein